jgi:hypothetical protein
MTDTVAAEMRHHLARLRGPYGAMGRDERMDTMRRLLGAEPDSQVMIRLAAHALIYAHELRELEDRAEKMAAGQMRLGDVPP